MASRFLYMAHTVTTVEYSLCRRVECCTNMLCYLFFVGGWLGRRLQVSCDRRIGFVHHGSKLHRGWRYRYWCIRRIRFGWGERREGTCGVYGIGWCCHECTTVNEKQGERVHGQSGAIVGDSRFGDFGGPGFGIGGHLFLVRCFISRLHQAL